ncbi:hypothetical protein [Bacillus paramobilis]|uniref:hypothetical protein n=1 Tax=Bacillus paramobilis TaxID=2817477 RepID=UPI001BB37743|nr:hypothetical protein [Bacillus paramobilis]HEF5065834.1 hypothetical protein [Bacillus cereus]HEF5237818.1 hypothetical protein [Bacillus cereus]
MSMRFIVRTEVMKVLHVEPFKTTPTDRYSFYGDGVKVKMIVKEFDHEFKVKKVFSVAKWAEIQNKGYYDN